jgi:hypothetical protein
MDWLGYRVDREASGTGYGSVDLSAYVSYGADHRLVVGVGDGPRSLRTGIRTNGDEPARQGGADPLSLPRILYEHSHVRDVAVPRQVRRDDVTRRVLGKESVPVPLLSRRSSGVERRLRDSGPHRRYMVATGAASARTPWRIASSAPLVNRMTAR